MLKIAIIVGSVRPNRVGPAVAEWFHETVKDNKDVQFDIVDLKDANLPLLDEPMPAMMGQYANEHTKRWAETIDKYDGYVLVVSEYNHGYSASLKNALDYLYAEWNKKPVAFLSYGVSGGLRAVEQLRTVVINLDMVPLNAQLWVNIYSGGLSEAGKVVPEAVQGGGVDKFVADLTWWAKALKTARQNG
jgi:NAD(P)H-dependent FMN reductase